MSLKKIGFGATVVFAFALGAFMRPTAKQMASPDLFNQVFKLVSNRFVDSLDTSALYDKAARGLVEQLHDPYADLYDPEQLKEFAVMAEGHYAGVGMLVEDQNGSVVVSRVFPHTPAEEAGIQEGDHIVGLDGQTVAGWSLTKVTNGLKGPEGTKVTATFSRPGALAPIVAHFTRRIIHIPAVPFTSMLPGGIGYIPLQQFNETAGLETRNAVQALTAQGARGIVLDMRGNGGGLVNEAVKVANLFLAQGSQVAAQRERGREPLIYVAREQPLAPSLPLIVLVDSTSASATEIVTGALQDHDRALVVGTRTFGKGLVQSVFDLDDGYALKLTTGKWYTPSGRTIHRDRVMMDGRLV
ncbi:MAG TPA: S41 family peptidase, partial [Longimicrobium sp.]|nr:S41 family peptidase [Longimicrobium sp.]